MGTSILNKRENNIIHMGEKVKKIKFLLLSSFLSKGQSPYNCRLSDFSFYIDSQISVHRKFKKKIN
jgi:hypothetical protein